MWGESAPGCTLLTALQHRPGSKAPNSCKTHSLMAHSVIQSASRIMLCKNSCINPSLYSVTNPEQKYTNLNSFKWILCVKINVLLIVFNIKSDYSSRLTHWMLLKPLKIHQIQITAAVPTKKKVTWISYVTSCFTYTTSSLPWTLMQPLTSMHSFRRHARTQWLLTCVTWCSSIHQSLSSSGTLHNRREISPVDLSINSVWQQLYLDLFI